jgi:hypothetical protein
LRDVDGWYNTPEDRRTKSDMVSLFVYTRKPNGAQVPLVKEEPVSYRFLDAVRGDIQRPIAVTPRLSVTLDHRRELTRAHTQLERFFNVTLRSAVTRAMPVTVSLNLPSGLSADSASRTVTLDSAGTRTISFRVRGRLNPGTHTVSASATADGATYSAGYVPIEYEHISPQRMYGPARTTLSAIDLRVPNNTQIGYIQGVGDNVAPSLEQLGIPVTIIDPRTIPAIELTKFSAVVVGPRAYEAHRELVDNNNYLLAYVERGGTLVVQYGQYEMMRPGIMPYSIAISRPHDRVTEEVAPIRILDTRASAFNRPNEISAADFSGWVQERGLYMPRTFDERYHPLLELNDPGAPPNRGGIIVAPYGKGLYVYTTLAFFRQLPAGVPGAARLFVNLLSLDRASTTAGNRAAQ